MKKLQETGEPLPLFILPSNFDGMNEKIFFDSLVIQALTPSVQLIFDFMISVGEENGAQYQMLI